jgi:methyl-accepting chemotaxis protein
MIRPRPAAEKTLGEQLSDASGPAVAALASMNANCFIADLNLNLVFMSRKAATTAKQLAPAVKSAFGVELDQILNGSIHRFHKDPGRIERILNDAAATPREAEFSFGGISLRTLINAITDSSGKKLGYIVVWDDVTDRNKQYQSIREQMLGVSSLAQGILDTSADGASGANSLAGATDELRTSVTEIARSTAQTTAQVTDAVSAVRVAVATVQRLQQASHEIGAILRLITGVADQTKLLALNATIEAARAGESGKGFAVVADEVKNLAGTTAASTSDIESRIMAIQESAEAGAEGLVRIEELILLISESQATISAAIEEQSAVAQEIASSTTGLAEGTQRTEEQARTITDAMAQVVERTDRLQSQG